MVKVADWSSVGGRAHLDAVGVGVQRHEVLGPGVVTTEHPGVHDGEATISCLACATDGADHFWRLSAATPAPDRAELSEELYVDLALRRAQRAISAVGGHDAQ